MEDIERCPFEHCGLPPGHVGPHGFPLGGGVVLAPHGGGEGEVGAWGECELSCDCCGKRMVVRKYSNGGGELKCTACDQFHTFSSDGRHSVRVLASLFPSNIEPGSKIHIEFLEYRKKELCFKAQACRLLGLLTGTGCDEQLLKISRAFEEERARWCHDGKVAGRRGWFKQALTRLCGGGV